MSEQVSQSTNLGWEGIIPHLLKAQREVGAVEKASRNDFGNYKYASAEDMMEASREVLHSNGLAVVCNGWRMVHEEGQTSTVEAVYILAHESGHSVILATQYPVCVGKGRPEDKALNASLTTGMSYFLRGLLQIPRCDEEVDQRPDSIANKGGVRATSKPPASSKGNNNKHKFMGAVGRWINRDITEQDTTDACINILTLHTLPTDGSAAATQFKEMLVWVEEQIENNVDPSDILRGQGE